MLSPHPLQFWSTCTFYEGESVMSSEMVKPERCQRDASLFTAHPGINWEEDVESCTHLKSCLYINNSIQN